MLPQYSQQAGPSVGQQNVAPTAQQQQAGAQQQQQSSSGPHMLAEPLRTALDKIESENGADALGPLGLCALGRYVARDLQHRTLALLSSLVFGMHLKMMMQPQKVAQIRTISAECGGMLKKLRKICEKIDKLKLENPVNTQQNYEDLYFSLIDAASTAEYSQLNLDSSIQEKCEKLRVERDELAAEVDELRAKLNARTHQLRTADWQAGASLDQLYSFGVSAGK